MIRSIHYIWLRGPLPDYARANIAAAMDLCPGFEYHVWDDRRADLLPPEMRTVYESMAHAQAKTDLLRFYLIRRFGGWHLDCDARPVRDLAETPDHHRWGRYAGAISDCAFYAQPDWPHWDELLAVVNAAADAGPRGRATIYHAVKDWLRANWGKHSAALSCDFLLRPGEGLEGWRSTGEIPRGKMVAHPLKEVV